MHLIDLLLQGSHFFNGLIFVFRVYFSFYTQIIPSLYIDELINYDLDEVTPHNLAAKISRIATYSKLLLALNDSIIVPPAAKTFGINPAHMLF